MHQMKKILVIGYGNTVRGDDAAGISAAELIAKSIPEITCLCVHQLMPDLAEQISECDIVIFTDADSNASKLSIRQIKPADEIEQPRTHFISPESLIALSKRLYERIPSEAYIIGIPASKFDFSEELSAETSQAVRECVEKVKKLSGS
jgi:hydrogenase maturation protease